MQVILPCLMLYNVLIESNSRDCCMHTNRTLCEPDPVYLDFMMESCMHSSRMHTARLLSVFVGGGVCLWSGVCPHGIVGRQTSTPYEQTNTCKNITFPQLRLWAVKMVAENILTNSRRFWSVMTMELFPAVKHDQIHQFSSLCGKQGNHDTPNTKS